MNFGTSFSVPTFSTKPKPEKICVKDTSAQGLKKLKKRDGFLYFSIPQVRNFAILHQDQVASLKDEGGQGQQVVRKTRLSTECHPDLHLEGMFDQYPSKSMDQSSDELIEEKCSLGDEDDLFLCLLEMKVKASRKRKASTHWEQLRTSDAAVCCWYLFVNRCTWTSQFCIK